MGHKPCPHCQVAWNKTERKNREAVVHQWIRPRTLNREVPGLNLLAAAVVPLDKVPSLPCPSERTQSRWSRDCLLQVK